MNKNGWVAIVIIVLVLLVGWAIYAGMNSNQNTDLQGTDTNTDVNMKDNQATTDQSSADDDNRANEELSASTTVGVGVTANKTVSFTVKGSNFTFSPKELTVNKGDTVKVTFVNDNGTHDFHIDEFNAKTRVLSTGESQTISFVADKAGDFQYYCAIGNHRAMGMWGTLHVK